MNPQVSLFQHLSIYFFIPLLLGVLMLVDLRRTKKAGSWVQKGICIVLLMAGLSGSTYGFPFWYAQLTVERAERAYFAGACKARAIVQLPSSPVSADGLVWMEPAAARKSYLSNRDDYLAFVDPGKGRYLALETQSGDGSGFGVTRWDSSKSRLDLPRFTSDHAAMPSLPLSIRTRPIATPEDARHGVDGIETTISETATGRIIARRVVLARYPLFTTRWGAPLEICPEGEATTADCGANGCSVLNFALTAVPSNPPEQLGAAFDLYRGAGSHLIGCTFGILVGPSVGQKDLEVWVGSDRHGEAVHVRIRGTGDEVTCNNLGARHLIEPLTVWVADQPTRPISFDLRK